MSRWLLHLILAAALVWAALAAEWKVEHWHCVGWSVADGQCARWVSLPQYARNWWVLDMGSGAALW
jgi:hypothetical protein